MPRKNKSTPWTLRPGDAILPAALEAHPELASMTDDAVFRMLLSQQRVGMPPAWRQVLFFIVVIGFVLGMNVLPRMLRSNIPVMILCIALLTIGYVATLVSITNPRLVARLTGRTLTVPVLARLTNQNLIDLGMAGIGPRDYLTAIWASFLRLDSVRNYRRVGYFFLVVPLVLIALGSLLPNLRDALTWVFVYFTFFAGQMLVMSRHPMPMAFNFACQSIRQCRRKFIRANWHVSRRMLAYILLVSLLPGISFVLLQITQYSLPVLGGMMFACILCGVLAGRMLIADFNLRQQKRYGQALEDLEFILNRMYAEFDKLPAQPQS